MDLPLQAGRRTLPRFVFLGAGDVMKKFYTLSETINKKEDKRVVSVTIKPLLTDMSGTVWITDLMLQEGDRVTGFHPHTETTPQKQREGETIEKTGW